MKTTRNATGLVMTGLASILGLAVMLPAFSGTLSPVGTAQARTASPTPAAGTTCHGDPEKFVYSQNDDPKKMVGHCYTLVTQAPGGSVSWLNPRTALVASPDLDIKPPIVIFSEQDIEKDRTALVIAVPPTHLSVILNPANGSTRQVNFITLKILKYLD